MARRTKEEAEETKKAVMLSALDSFCEKGYSKTTFDDIAKRINLTKGAIYWHFRNKPDILSEIIRTVFNISRANLAEKIPSIQGLGDLQQYFLHEAALIRENKLYRQFLFFVIFQMEWSQAMINKVTTDVQHINGYMKSLIKEALTFSQKSGEISPSANIDDAVNLISCFWDGALKTITQNTYADNIINSGFKIIIKGLQDERSGNEIR